MRIGIHHTERAECNAIAGGQRHARIEANKRAGNGQRMRDKAGVLQSVRHDKWITAVDGIAAKGVNPRRGLQLEVDRGPHILILIIKHGNKAAGYF